MCNKFLSYILQCKFVIFSHQILNMVLSNLCKILDSHQWGWYNQNVYIPEVILILSRIMITGDVVHSFSFLRLGAHRAVLLLLFSRPVVSNCLQPHGCGVHRDKSLHTHTHTHTFKQSYTNTSNWNRKQNSMAGAPGLRVSMTWARGCPTMIPGVPSVHLLVTDCAKNTE